MKKKIRVTEIEGPCYYLVCLALYLAGEIIGKLLLSIITLAITSYGDICTVDSRYLEFQGTH